MKLYCQDPQSLIDVVNELRRILCDMTPIFMQLTGQSTGGIASSAFLGQKRQLTGQNLYNEHA